MKILLTGKNGQVGFELHRNLGCLGDVIATHSKQLDLRQSTQLREQITAIKPDLIVNAAAYTAVDKAETDAERAHEINAVAPAVMAEEARKRNIPLIHYSTDYVFNGQHESPWTETDSAEPLGVYGQTKFDGEQAIRESGCDYLIFRTSWIYGHRGHNFLNTMRRLAAEKEQIAVVNDQFGAPTWCRHIADTTAQIIAISKQMGPAFWQQHTGLYHLTAAGKTSWHGFAEAIFAEMRQQGVIVPIVKAISSDEYPTPAVRPSYSCLDNTKLKQHFGLQLPDWRESLRLMMQG